jgi:hypothetical protein
VVVIQAVAEAAVSLACPVVEAGEVRPRAGLPAAVRRQQAAGVRPRAGLPVAVRRQQVAGVRSARHATARPLEAVAEGAVFAMCRVRGAPERPSRAVALAEPLAVYVVPARLQAVVAVPDAGEAVEAAVRADAVEQPQGVAAAVGALQDVAVRPAAAVPDAEVRRPGVGAAAQDAAVRVEAAVAWRVAGRPWVLLSAAVWVCHRDRPRPAAARPGPRREARPAQTKQSLQCTSPSARSWQAAQNEFWSCDFWSRNHFWGGRRTTKG